VEEYRLYRRDEKGRIVKANDHLMDATRYAVRSGLTRAKTQTGKKKPSEVWVQKPGETNVSWMS
jgi:hypothetical protein